MSDHLLLERRDAVATVVLNKPKSHNAIGIDMYRDLPGLFQELDADPEAKVVVLRGAGEKAFASGADISEFEQERGDAESARHYNEQVAAAEQAVETMTKPMIAMIHGYCIGGGAGLMLVCGVLGFFMRRYGMSPAALVIALLLGPLAEESLRQTMIISGGSADIFLERTTSVALLVIMALLVALPLLTPSIRRLSRQGLDRIGRRRAATRENREDERTGA